MSNVVDFVIKDLDKAFKKLNQLNDNDKINVIREYQSYLIIKIDNDSVYIDLKDDISNLIEEHTDIDIHERWNASFNGFGYQLLPTLFNFLGMDSNFV